MDLPQTLADHDEEPPRLLLSINETARSLSVGRRTVYKLMEEGELEYLMVRGRRCVPIDALKDFVERQRAKQ